MASQNVGVSCCDCAALSSTASPELSTWYLSFSSWSLQSWGFDCSRGFTLTSYLSCPFTVLSLSCSLWPCHPSSHATWETHHARFSCHHKEHNRPCLDHSFCALTLRKPFLEDFLSMIFIPSWQPLLSKQSKCLLYFVRYLVNHTPFFITCWADTTDYLY